MEGELSNGIAQRDNAMRCNGTVVLRRAKERPRADGLGKGTAK